GEVRGDGRRVLHPRRSRRRAGGRDRGGDLDQARRREPAARAADARLPPADRTATDVRRELTVTKTAPALGLILPPAAVLLGALPAHAAPQTKSDFLGKWTVTASQPAPWSKPDDKPVESDLKALMSHDVVFLKDRIEAPSPLRCRKPHYEM